MEPAKHTTVNEAPESRHTQVKKLLISQPKPTDEKSPYLELAKKYNLSMDFHQFIKVEPMPYKEFRKQKIEILSHTAVIFTSRNAVDQFFSLMQEGRVEMPADFKYFCISEQTANYLQKYIVVRKRKVFTGTKTAQDLIEIIKKHKAENFIFPCSNIRKEDIPLFMKENGYKFTEAVIYNTVASNLSEVKIEDFDLIAFFSPSGVNSLFVNFPEFKQNGTRIAAFGPSTAKAVTDAGLILDVQAPLPDAPSMTGAIENYIKRVNKAL